MELFVHVPAVNIRTVVKSETAEQNLLFTNIDFGQSSRQLVRP
jgi:hypothetical protein